LETVYADDDDSDTDQRKPRRRVAQDLWHTKRLPFLREPEHHGAEHHGQEVRPPVAPSITLSAHDRRSGRWYRGRAALVVVAEWTTDRLVRQRMRDRTQQAARVVVVPPPVPYVYQEYPRMLYRFDGANLKYCIVKDDAERATREGLGWVLTPDAAMALRPSIDACRRLNADVRV
jgi:hypothetical protein